MVRAAGLEPETGGYTPTPVDDRKHPKNAVSDGGNTESERSPRTLRGQSGTPRYAPDTTPGAVPEQYRSTTAPEQPAPERIDPDVLALAQKLAALPPEARAALKALLD